MFFFSETLESIDKSTRHQSPEEQHKHVRFLSSVLGDTRPDKQNTHCRDNIAICKIVGYQNNCIKHVQRIKMNKI
jgi:hypothetical protein